MGTVWYRAGANDFQGADLFSRNRSPQRREGLKDTQRVLSKGYNLCEPWRSLRLCGS